MLSEIMAIDQASLHTYIRIHTGEMLSEVMAMREASTGGAARAQERQGRLEDNVSGGEGKSAGKGNEDAKLVVLNGGNAYFFSNNMMVVGVYAFVCACVYCCL